MTPDTMAHVAQRSTAPGQNTPKEYKAVGQRVGNGITPICLMMSLLMPPEAAEGRPTFIFFLFSEVLLVWVRFVILPPPHLSLV